MPRPSLKEFPASTYRIGRKTGPIHFGEIDAVDAANAGQGMRFDVVGGGVMYCATTRVGAFKEVLAPFRPSSRQYAQLTGESIMDQGSMPTSWRDRRALVELSLEKPLPFIDLESDATLTYLTSRMAEELDELGVQSLDVSVVRGPNRLITRAIAQWIYTRVDEDGVPLYGGIRYLSRFESEECWAVFDGAEVRAVRTAQLVLTDPQLKSVARDFGITLH